VKSWRSTELRFSGIPISSKISRAALLASPSISVYLYNCVCVYIYVISTYLNLLHDKAVWLAKNLSGLVRSVVT
jgi:hypothetical protein